MICNGVFQCVMLFFCSQNVFLNIKLKIKYPSLVGLIVQYILEALINIRTDFWKNQRFSEQTR